MRASQVDTAQREVVRTLCSVFHKHWAKWRLTVETLAEIDAVCALARASMGDDGLTMCRPEVCARNRQREPMSQLVGMSCVVRATDGGCLYGLA